MERRGVTNFLHYSREKGFQVVCKLERSARLLQIEGRYSFNRDNRGGGKASAEVPLRTHHVVQINEWVIDCHHFNFPRLDRSSGDQAADATESRAKGKSQKWTTSERN